MSLPIFIIVYGVPFIIFIILHFSKKKCPNCQTRNTKKINSIEVDRYQSTKQVTDETKNRRGDVIFTTTREIPVTIACYKETYKCNECGEIFTRTKRREL